MWLWVEIWLQNGGGLQGALCVRACAECMAVLAVLCCMHVCTVVLVLSPDVQQAELVGSSQPNRCVVVCPGHVLVGAGDWYAAQGLQGALQGCTNQQHRQLPQAVRLGECRPSKTVVS